MNTSVGTTSNTAALWTEEYRRAGIPSSFRSEPSGSVIEFLQVLGESDLQHKTAIDIGCGTGRNTLFFASIGCRVHSIDIVPSLVRDLANQAMELGFGETVKPTCQSVAARWPIEDRSCDLAIDTFCFKHLIPEAERAIYMRELDRVLKPHAHYLLTLAGTDDGYYGPLLSQSPDLSARMIVDPVNQIASILYSKVDIEQLFASRFDQHYYSHKQKMGVMHGGQYLRSTHLFVMTHKSDSC
jgi:SAM-dependent methyltransferase